MVTQTSHSSYALGPVDETALRNAWALYTQQKYAQAADAFEALIRTSTPNARLYYYAASANRNCNRIPRAKQLCQYIVANFAKSAEAPHAQKLLAELETKNESAAIEFPAHLKGKSVEELMQTEEGRKAIKEAIQKQQSSTTNAAAANVSAKPQSADKSASAKAEDRAFSIDDIAKDGAAGVNAFSDYSNGSLECVMAALANLPRGQKLLADMIRCPGGQDTYVVRFPGGGSEYLLTPQKVEECRVKDKAQWATLIHCALQMNAALSGSIDDVLTCLTGKKAERIHARGASEQVLTAFIQEALKAQSPIVCESAGSFNKTALVEESHAYTIIDFDPANKMITLRDPKGANSRRFRLEKSDPDYKHFEQLNDGVSRMHISLFPQYFSLVARSML
ncbi:MAG TPA: hypothetical protein V6D17_00660 [Candidatus Obscuribacterales bacterium]